MEDIEKLLKESLSFSKFESTSKEFKGELFLKEEKTMNVSRILIVSLPILAVLIGGLLLVNQFLKVSEKTVVKEDKVLSTEQTTKEEVPEVSGNVYTRGIVSMVVGDVKIQSRGVIFDAEVGYILKQEDVIRTGKSSECEVQVDKRIVLRIGEKTEISLSEIVSVVEGKKESIVDLVKGTVKSAVGNLKGGELKVRTSTAIAAVRGTKFMVYSDENGGTRVIVSEGKVSVGIRSKTLEEQIQKLNDEQRKNIEKNVLLSVVVKEGEQVYVDKKIQKKVEQSVQSSLPVGAFDTTDDFIEEINKIVKQISSKNRLVVESANKQVLASIDKSISKDIMVDYENSVRVSFLPTESTKDAMLYINNVEISSIPVERILGKNVDYIIGVKKDNKFIFKEKMRFTKDSKITIDVKEELKPKEEKTVKMNFGMNIVSGYGKWAKHGTISLIPSSSGVIVFDGKSIKSVGVKGLAYGFGDGIIVSLSKDENEFIVVNISSFDGGLLQSINLGESSRGTLVVSRPAVLGDKVFVPSIDGVYIIDIKTGDKKVAKIGSVYSDIVAIKDRAISINEIGEVYSISGDGSHSKIGQMSLSIVRKASLSSDGENLFVFLKGRLHIVNLEKFKEISVNTDIQTESLPISTRDRIILFGDRKIVSVKKNGEIEYEIDLNGKQKGMPYVGEYIVATTTQGVFVYNVNNGEMVKEFDIQASTSLIIGDKLYVVSSSETLVLDIK
ncbi:MAG: FecR domain-containing protein [Brevinematales bacterium]|nr:FecR domain-containing protein [Brevinematales bacterium]